MTDDDLREEVERLREDVDTLERRLESIEAALERYVDDSVGPDSRGDSAPNERRSGDPGAAGKADERRSGDQGATGGRSERSEASGSQPRESGKRPQESGSRSRESEGSWGQSSEAAESRGSPAWHGDADEPPEPADYDDQPSGPVKSFEPGGGSAPEASAQASTAEAPPDSERAPPAEAPGSDGRNLELDLGRRWLAVAGAITLVLGIAFLVNVAVDRGWIGPLTQLGLGLVAGIALTVGGRAAATRRGYERWGMAVAGAGIALVYLVGYVAYAVETYQTVTGLSLGGAVGLLSVVVAVAVVLGVRDDTRIVAGESFALGYLTMWIGRDLGEIVLFAAVVLGLGIAATVAVRQWRWLPAGGVVGSYALYWGAVSDPPTWLAEGTTLAGILIAFGAAAALSAVDGGLDSLQRRLGTGGSTARNHDADGEVPADHDADGEASTSDSFGRLLPPATTVLNVSLFALSAYVLLGELAPTARAPVFVALAVAIVGYDALVGRIASTRDPTAPYLAVGAFVLAAPLAVDGPATTLALAGIAAVVGPLAALADDWHYRNGAYGTAIVLAGNAVFVDAFTAGAFEPGNPTSLGALHAGAGAAIVLGVLAAGYRSGFARLRSLAGRPETTIDDEPPEETGDRNGSQAGQAPDSAGEARSTGTWGSDRSGGESGPPLSMRLRRVAVAARPHVWHAWLALLALAAGIAGGLGGGGWWSVTGAGLVLSVLGLGLRTDSLPVGYSADAFALLLVGRILFVDLPTLSGFDPGTPLAASKTLVAVAGIIACYLAFWLLRAEDRWLGRGHSALFSIRLLYLRAGTLLVVAVLIAELSGFEASAAWAVVGFLLLGIGVGTGLRDLRYQSLGVLLLATVKVFLVDTSGLDPLARALSFIVLALVLLAASYLYARYGDRIVGEVGGGAEQPPESETRESERSDSGN